MSDQDIVVAIENARLTARATGPERESRDISVNRGAVEAASRPGCIAFIESRTFVRECMHRGMQAAFSLPVVTYSTLSELERQSSGPVALVLLSLPNVSQAECASALKTLSELAPNAPIVVLATAKDMDLARTAISNGAKGYIPCTTNFEIAVEAVRFILVGGTYVPMDYVLSPGASASSAQQAPQFANLLTAREGRVVQAIQEGKSNKVIAYELSICESTVKVHLRNVMKKLKAKNRTEVAIKAKTALALEGSEIELPRRAPTLSLGVRDIMPMQAHAGRTP